MDSIITAILLILGAALAFIKGRGALDDLLIRRKQDSINEQDKKIEETRKEAQSAKENSDKLFDDYVNARDEYRKRYQQSAGVRPPKKPS